MTAPDRIYVYVAGSPVLPVLRQEWLLEPSEIAVTVEYIRADLVDPAAIREAALMEAARLLEAKEQEKCASCGHPRNNHPYRHPFSGEHFNPKLSILALIPKGAAK